MPIDPRDFGEQFHPKRRMSVSGYTLATSVGLRNGRIHWNEPDLSIVGPYAKPTVKTFADFLNLADATDEQILAYAERWGPLGLHDAREGETCDLWRRLARIAGAVLRVSQRHYDGERANAEDWQLLQREACVSDVEWYPKEMRQGVERLLLSAHVNDWLKRGQVRPVLLPNRVFDIEITGKRLFGALAVQLLELVGRYAIAACSGCHKFYFPTIAPKAGQDRYCEKCRDAGIPVARAMHRRNLRRQEERTKLKRIRPAPKR